MRRCWSRIKCAYARRLQAGHVLARPEESCFNQTKMIKLRGGIYISGARRTRVQSASGIIPIYLTREIPSIPPCAVSARTHVLFFRLAARGDRRLPTAPTPLPRYPTLISPLALTPLFRDAGRQEFLPLRFQDNSRMPTPGVEASPVFLPSIVQKK